jgi:UDP-glucose 4-epimerase
MIKEVLGSDLEPEYVANPIKNYVYRTKADTKKAEQDLGFKARVSLKEGIERLVKHYRNYREIASLP